MTSKLLDIPKTDHHAENKATSLRHSKHRARIEKIRKCVSRSEVKLSKAPNYFESYRSRYSDQPPSISGHMSCTPPLFRGRDLEPVTSKPNRDLYILKMHLQIVNKVARSSHSKYVAWIEKVRKWLFRSKVKCHQLRTISSVHHGTYPYQVTSVSDRQF